MDKYKISISKRRKIGTAVVLVYCLVVAISIVSTLLFNYKPDQNALGALGTVCFDVLSIVFMMILTIALLFEREAFNRTTRLFLLLMLGTIWGLFFDFLTWSYDGALSFENQTYIYVVASLCTGAVLAMIFCLYLNAYLTEVHNLKSSFVHSRICVAINFVSLCVSFVLAMTRTAFSFVDGHYQTGTLYDIVTIIPILTLIYMTGYIICNAKVIGAHDVVAVIGYIVTMIIGAVVEAVFVIGTTFVGVTIANIFIFVMLQNHFIDNVKKQRELLTERIASQYDILVSMAGIYSYVNYVDLVDMSEARVDVAGGLNATPSRIKGPHSTTNRNLYDEIEDEYKENFWDFTDLYTLPDRMAGEKIISAEFRHKKEGWIRAQYIRIGATSEDSLERVIYVIRNIDEEKKNVEKWIVKSNTDEMTGFLNRHAYEEDIAKLTPDVIKDKFVYVSIDINSLKMVNDTYGHDAGDELIVGAGECMRQCFGSYGKLYRTGGDEFAALIYADGKELENIKKDIEEVTEGWNGKLIDSLNLSCGYVTRKEAEGQTIHEMSVLADKRMYDEKTKYYQKKGIDRRGQRDAHVALCALFTKILKVNLTDDSYIIVNMSEEEKKPEAGFSEKISVWLHDFGTIGRVHGDDLDEYLTRTDLEYIKDFFRSGNKSLKIQYRRMYNDGYRQTMLEMIPANNYTDEEQNIFLYVKDIE